MSAFKGITLHEGYNEIGTFDVNITEIENPSRIVSYAPETPRGSRKLLFRLMNESAQPVTQAYVANFTVLGRTPSENAEYATSPNTEGYVEIDTPVLPVVTVPEELDGNALLRLNLKGPLNERGEECYIEVLDALSAPVYTLIRDIFIDPVSVKLAIQSESDVFYLLATDIEITVGIKAVHVTAGGEVFGFDDSLGEWELLDRLEFTMIEFPENLDVVEDGFYTTNGTTGTLTTFEPGETGYEEYHVDVLNPGIYLVNVDLEVSVEPDGVVYTGSFTNLMPGDLNFTVVTVPGSAPVAADDSPTIEEIATLTGITFSVKFLDFLEDKGLTTVDRIRKAGPINYINDFDSADISDSNLKTLQAHVIFYAINKNAVQNQRIISQGFKNIFAIAYVPMKTFLDAVVNVDLPLFQAAKIHEIAVRNEKLTGNLLPGLLSDLRLANPATPEVEGSNFVDTALAKTLNSCGCDDCKSVISPFSYLFDLLKYGGAHVEYTGTPPYQQGGNLGTFIELMADNFLQPFDTLKIDCKTLHDEFCRVRLVTEVLEKKVLTVTPPASLAIERKQFFQLVYQTILLQAGSSFNEVRSVYLTAAADKLAAAQKLSDKLGIPLYVPATTDYTVDVLWLTIGNTGYHELTAVNLEDIFGFRDTKRSAITNTPVSKMELWHAAYLRDFWKTQDYVFTNYSREDVVPGSPGTLKSNWLPIIDPDIIGWEDMSYLGSAAADPDEPYVHTAIAAKKLWKNRKAETDRFLKECLVNNSATISADIKSRILKVLNEDIVNHIIENETIYIQDPSDSDWYPFVVNSRTLNGTDTDVNLIQSSAIVFNPESPFMKYNRELTAILPGSISGLFLINWPTPVIQNATGKAKLISSTDAAVYSTESSPPDISFTVNSELQVGIQFLVTPPGSGWTDGVITLIYEVEVDLYTTSIVDPVLLSANMFVEHEYNPLTPPVITEPQPYYVWDAPAIGPTPTYNDIKMIYSAVSSGSATTEQLEFVSNNLRLSISAFNRLMVLMGLCEKYLASIYTAPRPTTTELYEMASILYTCAKLYLRSYLVEEEINYVEDVDPIKLQLSGQYFWKALNEPAFGSYDPSMQTIPDAFIDVDPAIHLPIINPLTLAETSLCQNPEAKPYRDLYADRKDFLDTKYDYMLGLITPYANIGFNQVLNYVNTGNKNTAFNILPFLTLPALITALTGMDPFAQKEAADVVYNAFGISATDFLEVYKIKLAYEDQDATKVPVQSVLAKAIRLMLPGYVRMQKYFVTGGWIEEEINEEVKYYNVRKLRLAPGRGDVSNRKEWQRTLAAWNRQPFIQPDLVPPENIKNFIPLQTVYEIWNTRNTALITEYDTIETDFNSGLDADVLFLALQNWLNVVVSRSTEYFTETPPFTYLPYFLEIQAIEENGEDIRPNLELLGIKPAEYRFLINIYKLLETEAALPPGLSSMVESEFDDTINILIAIRSRNLPFDYVIEEYEEDILLDQDHFLIYKPALISFPLVDLPVYNQWRSPHKEKKAWEDILETRIEMEQGVKDRWKEVLKETEDRNLPLMRDALIRALTPECEAWQDRAEILAKTYFMETKDNCCVMHTRVSFAIETMQGFLNALNTGIYDGFVANFRLHAPLFRREWEWLGSYATWRAAAFVFIYPENLLYPTLKRLQSPAFRKLAETVQNANRFSPQNACEAAHEFQAYFEDIKDLDMCCNVYTPAYVSVSDPNDCCIDQSPVAYNFVYYFAKGKSGRSYWSSKKTDDNSKDSHSFWEELPVRKEGKLLGCFVRAKRADTWTAPEEVVLYLFYSYTDQGKLKIAYIKKNVYDANSVWSDENETDDIPGITENDDISAVTACQSKLDYLPFSFVVSYTVNGNNDKNQSARDYDPETDKWSIPTYYYVDDYMDFSSWPPEPVHIRATRQYSTVTDHATPFTCIRYLIFNGWVTNTLQAYAYVFEKQVVIRCFNHLGSESNKIVIPFEKVLGAFECLEDSTIIVFYLNSSGNVRVRKLEIVNQGGGPHFTDLIVLTSSELGPAAAADITRVYPVFSLGAYPIDRQLIFKTSVSTSFIGAAYAHPLGMGNVGILNRFALTPEKQFNTQIQSGECITNMDPRALDIKLELQANANSPEGTSVSTILRTNAVKEVLYEAYYFVPMLLALDQQKRGEFRAALDWYRSVYDYTMPVGIHRKIFYGLILEESIVNVYSQTPNWLLDPLNPHLIAQSRAYAYAQYTIVNIVQCLFSFADREFTLDTIETVPVARRLYTEALELLKVKELNLKPNRCKEVANDCIDGQVDLSGHRVWQNLYGKLKQKLQKLGDVALIEEIEEEIVELLSGGNDETYPGKFSDAFQRIVDVTPSPTEPQSVVARMSDSVKEFVAAHAYLYAINDHSNYNEQVARDFTASVTTVTGIKESELETTEGEERIAWLQQSIPSNLDMGYEFTFANEAGVQRMTGADRYDPLSPSRQAYDANLVYSNANSMFYRGDKNPRDHMPLTPLGFCMPKNPVYQSLVLKGNVEIYKILNCRNIAGMVRELDAYAAATDSVTGMPFIGASGNLVTPGIGNYAPVQYRFRTLIERAKQIVAQAQQMESLFLAALEKLDNESYSQLRARQDLQTAKATVKLQNLRITQATDEQGSALIQLDKATFTQQHFNELISAGQNAFEILSMILLASSAASYIVAGALVAVSMDTAKDNGSGAVSYAGQASSALSSLASQMASFQRRQEEWGFQKDLAGFDIKLANQQIKIAEDNVRIVTQERDIAQMNTDHAQDSLEFLKTKFTNAELYNYMSNVLERSYSYMLNLATSTARTAEHQLYFERQEQAGPFLLDDYWESPTTGGAGGSTDRRGLTGSARLAVDITRLDEFAFETNKRKLQMTKVISLAQNFPSEFQQFKETGVINFALTNRMFDYDFPGHYLRLINSVKTTVIGLLPVYDSIKATLTSAATSYTVIGGTIFQRTPLRRMSIDSVALTSANNATGVFEMQPMQSELMNPFENMGIESQWEFKMPRFSNHMDYTNIADVLLTVEYTALDSFQYRAQVLQDLDNSLSFNRGFSFKNNFPDQWYELADVEPVTGEAAGTALFSVSIELKREMFPQGILDLKLSAATGVLLYFARADGYTEEIEVADFNIVGATATGANGDTVNGIIRGSNIMNSSLSPLLKLRLSFVNNPTNRELFSKGYVTDILVLVGCKAELPAYPL